MAVVRGAAEEHFASEQLADGAVWLPPRDCHVDEHERVLASVREVCSLVAAGEFAAGRGLAPALADWFPAIPTIWTLPLPRG